MSSKMTNRRGLFGNILMLVLLHVSFSQEQVDLVPNVASFPDSPPPSGGIDAFEQPLTVTNANEQIALSALGDTITENPTVNDVLPQSDPILDVPEASPSIPSALNGGGVLGTTLPTIADEMTLTEPTMIEGEVVNVPVSSTIDKSPVEPTVFGSVSDVIGVADGGMTVDTTETTTQGDPITTVDSNFDPQGTFDGRNDPILLTGTVPSTNISSPLNNITSVKDVLNTISGNDISVDTPQETVAETATVSSQSVTDINTVNPNPIVDVLASDGTVDENMALPKTEIQNVVERPSVVDQTPPTNFMDLTTSTQQIYEEKLQEYESFKKLNPDTSLPGPPVPPPRRDQSSQIPTSDIPLGPLGESALETTVNTIVEDTSPTSDPIIDTMLPSKPTSGSQRAVTTTPKQRRPSLLPTEAIREPDTLVENSLLSPSTTEPVIRPKDNIEGGNEIVPSSDPILDRGNVAKTKTTTLPPFNRTPKRVIPTAPRTRPRTPMVSLANIAPPPPPPSDIFRKDFNEDTRQKANTYKYKPEIPYDPDFDFRPKQSLSTTRTSNKPVTTAEKSANMEVSGIQSIFDKTSRQNNAYPFALDESRKQTKEYVGSRRDSGMSLIQYQLTHKDEDSQFNTPERRNNQMKVVRNQSRRTSNDMQAIFDKDRKFEAKFGEPGMPIYSEYFNQNQNRFPYKNQGSNNADRFNSLRNQQSETVWSPNRRASRFTQDSTNARSFNDRMTMPPIVVVEDGTQPENRNLMSERSSAAARFQPREFENVQNPRTSAPYLTNRMENSLEMWYQLMGKDLHKNEIKNFQNGFNVRNDARNMGGRVLNRFWTDSNNARSQRIQGSKAPLNNRNNNANIEPVRKQAGSLGFNTRRQNQESQTIAQRSNAFVFEPQRRENQMDMRRDEQKLDQATKPDVQRNNAFAFTPRKPQRNIPSQRSIPKDTQRRTDSRTTFNKNNAFIFEPQMQASQIEVADPHRMKIREYAITKTPDLVSTTEARLNMGVPTLSKPLEPEVISNMLFSQDNPPPINIDGKIDNIAFQSLVTTPRPNTVLQPSVVSSSAFRKRHGSVQALEATDFGPMKTRVRSMNNLPRPPPIKNIVGSSSNNILNANSQAKPSSIKTDNTELNVEPKLNAVPFVPAEPMLGRKRDNIFDLPRPPTLAFGKSSSNGQSSSVVDNVNSGPSPTVNAQPFRDIPEVTPVPPLFSVNSTIVMKLQNDSVTKEELPPSVCHQCHYVSDVCFLSEAGICNRFVECHRNGDQVRAFEKECAIGNFWNPETLACQKSVYVNCSSDPCKNPAVKSHPFLGRCRYFWKCLRRTSELQFCSQNYRFDGIKDTCIPDFSCKDEDPPMDVKQEMEPGKCIWTAVDGTLTSFTDGFNTQKCAPGTRFDEVQCTCVISNIKPEGEICNPDTLIDFEGGDPEAFVDKSGHKNGIGKENVRLKDGTGFFYGKGKLSFWRYSNVELGPLLAIQIRFFPYGYSKYPMGLVSNCNGSPIGATVDIRLDTKTKQAVFRLSTNKQLNNEIVLPYEPFKWNTATYVYAGDTFTASINDKKETIPVEGSIPNRHPAIQIGGCNRDDGFRGYADDVKVYNGCIPEEFEYIIFT